MLHLLSVLKEGAPSAHGGRFQAPVVVTEDL